MDMEKSDLRINAIREQEEQIEGEFAKFLIEIKELNQKLSVLEEEKKLLFIDGLIKCCRKGKSIFMMWIWTSCLKL